MQRVHRRVDDRWCFNSTPLNPPWLFGSFYNLLPIDWNPSRNTKVLINHPKTLKCLFRAQICVWMYGPSYWIIESLADKQTSPVTLSNASSFLGFLIPLLSTPRFLVMISALSSGTNFWIPAVSLMESKRRSSAICSGWSLLQLNSSTFW